MSNKSRAVKIPVIPAVPSDASPAMRKTLEAIKQAIEVMAGTRGNELDKVVSKRDLESMGLDTKIIDSPATYDFSDSVVNSNGPVPNPPTDLEIFQRVVANKLTWSDPTDGKFTHIEVWASKDSQSFSDAELVGYVNKGIQEFEHDYVNVRSNYYYWIRSVNSYGKYSVWHPTLVQGGMLASAIVDETINDLLAQLMDDSKYETVYKIIADSFQVIQPTAGLEEGKKVFVIGQIDGKTAVGIAGDMFIDGFIIGKMIHADAITAEHIGAKEITADKYKELRNTIVYNGGDSLDENHPLEVPFSIPKETTTIISVKLSFKIMPYPDPVGFEIDNSTQLDNPVYVYNGQLYAARGGQVSSTENSDNIDIQSGTPGTKVYAIDMQLYTPQVLQRPIEVFTNSGRPILISGLPAANLTELDELHFSGGISGSEFRQPHSGVFFTMSGHDHIVYAHSHDIGFGIFEEQNFPTIDIYTDNGSYYIYRFTSTVDRLDYDLTSYFSTTGWKGIKFVVNKRCRIAYNIQLKIDIDA
jgi:hypothetical protein